MSDKQFDLLVIGAGPAGLSVAAEALYHKLGTVCVLEKGASHNQTVRQYYPDQKRVDAAYMGQEAICAGVLCFRDTTKTHFLELADQMVSCYGTPVLYHKNVDSIKKGTDGFFHVFGGDNEEFLARWVVVGIGRMGKPNRPDYFANIPSAARTHVHFDIRKIPPAAPTVLIVGGGNVAAEFALSLSPQHRVTLSYRQKEFTRLNPMNLSLLEKERAAGKLEVLLESNVTQINEQSGKPAAVFADGSSRAFDEVVFGIGGSSPAAFLQNCGMEIDAKGNPVLSQTNESSVPGLYVAGELAVPQGKGSIIVSFNTGKVIVEDIMLKAGLPRAPEIVHL